MKTFEQPRVAVVGATGAVGTTMTSILEERGFPVADLRLLASERSAGRVVTTRWGDVEIEDLAGDGDHYAAMVSSAAFKGKSRVQQHKMVYDALSGRMGGELHALSLQTNVKE